MYMMKNRRIHLVNLYKWRSIIAFIACLITIVFTLGSVAYGIIYDPPEWVKTEFQWFTVDSNCLTAFAAIMIVPFAIDGIRRKRFIYPKWALIIHYAGTICTTLTFVFALGIISWFDPELAFGEENIFLHIVCPLAVLVSFFMVESNHKLTIKDTFIALIPFVIYSLFYIYNVVFTGNWQDHYHLNMVVPYYVSTPLMYLLVYHIAVFIRKIHNKLVDYREKKMKMLWDEDIDPVTVKIEVYSLGVHAGLHQNLYDVSIPFDILHDLSEKINIDISDLAKAFVKGALDGLKDRERNKETETK